MNVAERFLDVTQNPHFVRLGLTLLHSVWQGAIILVTTAVALSFFRRATSRYIVACVGLALLPLLAVTTWICLDVRHSPAHSVARNDSENAARSPGPATGNAIANEPPLSNVPHYPARSSSYSPRSASWSLSLFTAPALVFLTVSWGIGVLVTSFRLSWKCVNAERARHCPSEPPEPLVDKQFRTRIENLGIRRRIRLRCPNITRGPMQIGWLRPVVVMPARVISILTLPQLDTLLLHELFHVRRRDYLTNGLQAIVDTLFFYHPASWWISRVIRQQRERCCDDGVVAVCGRVDLYVSALIAVAKLRLRTPSLAVSAIECDITRRVRRLCDPQGEAEASKKELPHRSGRLALLAVVAALFATVLWTGAELGFGQLVFGQFPEARRTSVASPTRAGPKLEPLNTFPLFAEAVDLREVTLDLNGQRLIAGRVSEDEPSQQFLVRLKAPGKVVIQVISRTAGFQPLLFAWSKGPSGADFSDSDKSSGRGDRPLLVINNPPPAPHNAVKVRVGFDRSRTDHTQFTGQSGEFIVHVRQTTPLNLTTDLDPETLGLESSPIVLDATGYGRVHRGKHGDSVPAINWIYDKDTFQIRSISNAPMDITVDGTIGEINPRVRLYDSNRQLLVEGPIAYPGRSVTLPIEKTKPDDVFYLAVTSFDRQTMGLYIVQVRQQRNSAEQK